MLTNKNIINYLKTLAVFSFLMVLSISVSFSQDKPEEAPEQATEEDTPAEEEEATGGGDTELYNKGKELFDVNCTSCHGMGDQKVVGPGMKGVIQRVPSKEWLKSWIKNSSAVIASGDPYAKKIYEEYNGAQMQSFTNLSDQDLEALIEYLEVGDDGGGGSSDDETKSEEKETVDNSGLASYFNLLLGILVVVLVLILAVLAVMLTFLTRYLRQQSDLSDEEKDYVNQRFEFGKFFLSAPFLGGIALIFLLLVAKSVIDGAISVGVQKGYAPTQPIAFSHKLHAGKYNIDCAYCHTGVYKGKSATIPTANICMNCHNAVKRDSPEIQKIYTALETDTPIEWVRVHNLPDLAYFNHSQHTNVAGIACEKCHGQIEKMEVVQQRAPLTMGWCINCHRETTVGHAEGNEYYDRLLEYHDKHSDEPMKVENIGGLECSKCHY